MKIKRLDHLVITTSRLDACLSFYENLGFEIHQANGRAELRCGTFKINVHTLGQELQPHAQNVAPGSADICLEVANDLDEVVKDLDRKGIKPFLGKSIRQGFYGPMQSVYLRDPDGNLVELSSYKPVSSQNTASGV